MRLRFVVGLLAVCLIGGGSVVAAIAVYSHDRDEFHRRQDEEANRAARQAQTVSELSTGQLASAAAFVKADGDVTRRDFSIIGRTLIDERVLRAAAFIAVVHGDERARYEREQGFEITESGPAGNPVRARPRPIYYPVTYLAATVPTGRALGFDLGSDPGRLPYLMRAREDGRPIATPVIDLILGGKGVNIYRAVYREGAPTTTPAERRRALVGFTGGSVTASDVAAAANGALPGPVLVQLRAGGRQIAGVSKSLDDPATATVAVVGTTWLLVVRDPDRPAAGLPILIGVIGAALAAVLGALIFVWSREERMRELQREADEDALTGLKNRRRFEEDAQAAMARRQRDGGTGALLMLDLDRFKAVNDTYGHPAGDRLIEGIADVLQRRTRAGDVVARLGGDEFAVVMPSCLPDEARILAAAIVGTVRTYRDDTADETNSVTCSVGVAIFGEDPLMSYASLVSEADTAMYAAKDAGGDGFRVFDAEAIRADAPERA